MLLTGRDAECEALDRLLADALGGRSRVVVLRGEPGVGKSALLTYVSDRAAGWRVARAVGVESEMELAYSGLHQLCAPMLDHLDQLPGPQQGALATVFGTSTGAAPDRFLVGLAVLTLFAVIADEQPLVCIVDDAQWLDQASAQILGFAARRLLAERIALVCAARTDIGDDVLAGLPDLPVQGLADSHARALLLDNVYVPLDAAVCEAIVAESRGNPLALLELPRTWTATDLAGGFGLPDSQPVAGKIEHSYAHRLLQLPSDTRLLVLAAAAEPLGDTLLLHRAAELLGLGMAAADPALDDGLLRIGGRVEFAHPLVRSVAYRSAGADDRHRVHRALAEATDPGIDPDRRAWHRARASAAPDEEVAAELERSATRAQSRGGVAAAAAFLRRAVALTAEPALRAERALAAARASLEAGAFDAALELAATAEAGPLDALNRARVELLRAQIAFASSRGSEAPAMLLQAVKRIEPLDAGFARASYLEALSAAMFAARLAGPGGGVRDVANAVRSAPAPASPPSALDLLLDGWAALFADGCAVAAPTLRAALRRFDDGAAAADQLLWLVTITAPVVWDDTRWDALSERHVHLARGTGALGELPLALNSRAYLHLFRGELETAARLIEEARVVIDATGASLTPWGAVALAGLRGREPEALSTLEIAATDSTQRGEGIGLTVIEWSRAVLWNGLGEHDKALSAAQAAVDCPTNSAAAAWGMVELVEAAARLDQGQAAGEHAERFAEIAEATGSEWAAGVNARTRALVSEDAVAEALYRRALDRLGRCGMRVDLARTHLLYGEWLRRRSRRTDARAQLRAAHDLLTSIGLEAFAERARKELLATGEKVRKRAVETHEDLTAQERQIAQLACDGFTNPEIGTRLFLSPRTVEWHLRKVFTKLGIRSRAELRHVLPSVAFLLLGAALEAVPV